MARQLGKQALLDAAAVLMDERGVDNVTLQDISQASGHRNRSAVQYHFGSRAAVIQAVRHLVLRAVPPHQRVPLFDQATGLLDEAGWGLDELVEAAEPGPAQDTLLRTLGLLD